jgi:hypothetical protein
MFFPEGFNYLSLIPFLAVVILVGGVLAAVFIKPSEFQKTRTFVFISIMGSVAVIILTFNVYLTTISLETQRTVNNAQFTKQTIDKLWLFPNQLLTEKTHARPAYLASLYYNNLELYKLTKDSHTTPTVASELDEQYISITLLQCWEDYLTLRTLEQTGDDVWMCNFLQWAQSPYLKKTFDTFKYNYASTTIKFGELLFEYARTLPIPAPNPETYKTLVDKLLKDPRLLKIFKERAEVT